MKPGAGIYSGPLKGPKMSKFRIIVYGPAFPTVGEPLIQILSVTVYYEAANSFAAYQYAKAVAGDYFGEKISQARFLIEELLA